MTDRTILRIDAVNYGGNTATNILSVREEHMMQVVPRFVPNTYQAPTVNQDHKWRELVIVFDSDTDIFNAVYSVTAANVQILNMDIDFTLTDGTNENWAYDLAYLTDRPEGRIREGEERHTYEYRFICYNAKAIS